MSLIRIDKLFNYEKGTLQSSKNFPGNYNFITASAEWKTHKEFTHDTEALIFAAAASGSLGRTHYVKGKFIASDLCYILTPKDNENLPIDLQFYHILFNTLRNDIVKNTKSGTSKESINQTSFGKYELPYFDLSKQNLVKIQFISQLNIKEKINTYQTDQLDLLKKLRQQVLQDAVQGKLVPQDPNDEPASKLLERIKAEKEKLIQERKIKKEKPLPEIKQEEIPFEIPENWVWCRLEEIISILGDGLHGTPIFTDNGEYYFVNGNNLVNGIIQIKENTKRASYEEYQKYKKYMNNNTVLVSINGTLGNLGFYNNEKIILGKSACYFNLLQDLNKYYIGLLIQSAFFLKYAVDVASETTIKNVSLKSMRNLPVPLPPSIEQRRIVSKVEQLMNLCNEFEQTILQNQKYIQDLLQVALKEALEAES